MITWLPLGDHTKEVGNNKVVSDTNVVNNKAVEGNSEQIKFEG